MPSTFAENFIQLKNFSVFSGTYFTTDVSLGCPGSVAHLRVWEKISDCQPLVYLLFANLWLAETLYFSGKLNC